MGWEPNQADIVQRSGRAYMQDIGKKNLRKSKFSVIGMTGQASKREQQQVS